MMTNKRNRLFERALHRYTGCGLEVAGRVRWAARCGHKTIAVLRLARAMCRNNVGAWPAIYHAANTAYANAWRVAETYDPQAEYGSWAVLV